MKRYAAFLSYSREGDAKLAAVLQRGIERFGSSWRQARVVRIFRDDASLSANTGLWSSIETALGSSSWFVILASPEAAASKWVNRELEWWLTNNSPDRILIVLTSGELIWDEQSKDFDQTVSTALPPTLRGVFAEEPRYVDARWSRSDALVSDVNPRLTEAIADIAATIRGIPKDELVGEAVRQQRRTRRIVRAVGVGFAVLFAGVVVAAVVALQQRSEAKKQATTSLTRQLAATSDSLAERDLDLSLLMAVQAYENEPTSTALGALIQANIASPHLVRFVQMDARVTELASSGNSETAFVGLEDGSVMRFAIDDPEPVKVMQLEQAITSIAVSENGETAAAADGKVGFVRTVASSEPVELRFDASQQADVVSVSPSGQTVVVHGEPRDPSGPESIWTFDAEGNLRYPPARLEELTFVSALILTSDERLMAFGAGAWEERRLADGAVGRTGFVGFGVRELAGHPAGTGERLTSSVGVDTIPVWSVNGAADHENPEFTAEVDLRATPTALALSPDGTRLVAADSGVIHVAPVAPAGEARPAAVELTGASTVNSDGVQFAGDDSHVLSASTNKIAIWDLRQLDRLATVSRVALGSGCSGCNPPFLAVSDDATRVAMTVEGGSFSGASAIVEQLAPGGAGGEPRDLPQGFYAEPVWIDGGPEVAFPFIGEIDGAVTEPGIHAWPAGDESEVIRATGPGPEPGSVVTVDSDGRIAIHDGVTGEILRELPGVPGFAKSAVIPSASVDGSGTLVARLSEEKLTITDLDDGEVSEPITVPAATSVRFVGDRLLIQHDDGSLEVRDPSATATERAFPSDETFFLPPVGNADGTLLARRRADGTVVLVDLGDGTTLGTLGIPEAETNKTGVAFSGDGNAIVTLTENFATSGDYLVERDLSSAALIDAACEAAGRPLSEEEWRRLVGVDLPDRLACAP